MCIGKDNIFHIVDVVQWKSAIVFSVLVGLEIFSNLRIIMRFMKNLNAAYAVKLAISSLLILTGSIANAVTDYNRTITSIGSQGLNVYVTISPQSSTGCRYGVLYIRNIGAATGRSMYAAVLSGYASNKLLARVDYVVESDGSCTVSLVQI